MQIVLQLFGDLEPPPPPTISTLSPGQAFKRTGKPYRHKYLYMVVDIQGDIQYTIKDPTERSIIIVNLGTGKVYTADPFEVIELVPNAAVVEDISKFKKK